MTMNETDNITNTKKEMAEKILGETLYTSEELHKLMDEMHKKYELEIERARLAEKIYKEVLFKVLKIEEEKKYDISKWIKDITGARKDSPPKPDYRSKVYEEE